MRWDKKGKFNATTFWSFILFLLIVAAVVVFFFGDFFNVSKVNYEQLGGNGVSLKIKDFKQKGGGIEFVLDIKPRGNEITQIEFILESDINKTEVYWDNTSYMCRTQKKYEIDLFKFHSSQISKILIKPKYNVLNYLPDCSSEINITESFNRSTSHLKRFFSKED